VTGVASFADEPQPSSIDTKTTTRVARMPANGSGRRYPIPGYS
jgi:hypothetical protein